MVYSRSQIIIEIPAGDKLLDQSKANAQFARDRPHHIVRGHTESVVPQDVKIVIFPLNPRHPVLPCVVEPEKLSDDGGPALLFCVFIDSVRRHPVDVETRASNIRTDICQEDFVKWIVIVERAEIWAVHFLSLSR